MSSKINYVLCRCCASEGTFKDLSTKYHWMGEVEIYADMLKDCFDVHLSSSVDSEEGGICEVCITQLRNAANFKKQVLHTEKLFIKRLQEKLYDTDAVKVEVSPLNDDLESDHVTEEFPEYEVPIKEEQQEAKPRKRAAKLAASRPKRSKADPGDTKRGHGGKELVTQQDVTIKKEGTKMSPFKQTLNEVKTKKEELKKHHKNLKTILQCSNATLIRCYGGLGYTCFFCNDQFPIPLDLKTHTLQTHSEITNIPFKKRGMCDYFVKLDITSLQCRLCNEYIEDIKSLLNHLNTVHEQKIFTDLKDYSLAFKFDDDQLKCYICLNVFTKFKKLQEHMNSHYRNYICEICDAGFINERHLYTHKECHEIGTFKCNFCPKIYDTDRKKKSHEKSVHSRISKSLNRCGCCFKTFRNYMDKQRHLVTVHGVPELKIDCQACDKVFTSRRMYTVHMKRDHLLEKPHKCSECDKAFSSSDLLKKHTLTHSGLKPFQCEVCKKCYGRRNTLLEHMRIHNNDRRFKCEHCGQAFIQKCSLKGHLSSKHGIVH
nr:zinc finger protein 616-like isoform X7 [Plodia interpunctella]